MKCLLCKTELQKNSYHRAIKSGAVWYCGKCDAHLNGRGRAVVITCACCDFSDKKEVIRYNNKIT